MKQIALIVLCVILANQITNAQVKDSERFVKPMKLKPSVSGSFGELRSNHFHSGLDLTTNRKTGYRVYASDKGYVSRIKVSPYGYGKAIYIDHDGGYTTVYAHLERYSNRIDSLVRAKQYEKKSFAIELFFKAGEVPVGRAEVIGYSGNSGSSGGPHLHYEVRDKASQKPMNPLLFRDDIKDDVRPQVQGMKLYCLSDDASIGGKRKDQFVSTVFYDRAFHPKGSTIFTAHGKIGVGVQVLDYFTDSWRKCGISTIDLFVNNTLVYDFKIEKFSFAETRYINSHIDYGEKKRTGKVIQKSWVEPNNRLSLYSKRNAYTAELKPGDTKIFKYVIEDFNGNRSVLAFTIKGENPPPPLKKKDSPLLPVNFDKVFTLDTLGLELSIPAKTFYTDIEMLIHKDEKESMIAPVYVIGDKNIPLHRSMTVTIPVPDSLQKYGDKLLMAGVATNGKTYSLGGQYKDGRMSTSTRSFGRFSLALDTIAPTIKLRKAPENNNYSARQSIELLINDEYSGIKNYECLIDDQWALFEYDAKNYRLTGTFKHMPFLKKGKHVLHVKVTDNRGNQTVKEFNFSN
ncbi:M23 family metallopeptidase [Carboxylicivirga sp. A043]|uniref:M23 family metallopeptidase n=1 Tax=Carboxylicivirga litoralis TaxID=2816963 RepID=UPI0021CB5C59|nr:M23 family metallopeptidase [Carboxylicivirga sp. A043]MCU4155494.1 M23 family metallopeptidase [Carboxylicivirga sp. A043]